MSDAKESLSNNRKPDITHVRRSFQVYAARAHEFGNVKYKRANFIPPKDYGKQDFQRIREYCRALSSHLSYIVDAMETHQGYDQDLVDVAGMAEAIGVRDWDAPENGSASGLPHLAAVAACANMLVEIAVKSGFVEEDPGQPWVDTAKPKAFSESDRPDLVFPKRREAGL